MPITITAHSSYVLKKLKALEKHLTPEATDHIIQRVAHMAHARLTRRTPKGFTGQTRRSWQVFKREASGYLVTNRSKVMKFLEDGTVAHGPKTAKALYIPLNRKAAIGGWNESLVFGIDYILRKRVKGIKAMKIVERSSKGIQNLAKLHMRLYIRNLLKTA